jgi:putative copper export protein/mono/diheme cytochrome c family protein
MALDGADLADGVARGLSMAGAMTVFGTALLRAAVARPALAASRDEMRRRAQRRLVHLSWSGLALTIAAGAIWLSLETVNLAPDESLSAFSATLAIVLWDTRFGWLLQIRLGLLLIAALMLAWRSDSAFFAAVAAVLAGTAVGLEAGLGHGVSMGGSLGLALGTAEVLHLVSAGAWLGALPGLLLLIGPLDQAAAIGMVNRFSRFGFACVLVLAATIVIQSWELMGGLPGLVGTDYGRIALVKLCLFFVLLAIAALNRFRLTPAMRSTGARHLRMSVALETVAGLLAVMAAGVLLTQQPAMHLQPDWPFAERFSGDALAEPELRPDVVQGFFEIGIAALVLAAAIFWRQLRWPGLALALVMAWIAMPNLRLLLVPAYPTSFYRSPTGFTSASIVRGAGLFAKNCAACHGAAGRGDGPLAKSLPIPPADLTAAHLFAHSDGELFWWLGHGMEGPNGSLVMPGFAATLDDDQRWNLIDYIRAHNAGLAAANGELVRPLMAPDTTVSVDGKSIPLSSLRGQWIRIAALGGGFTAIPPVLNGIVTLPIASPSDGWSAYAIASGTAPDALAGCEFLIDPDGWLRNVFRPAQAGVWPDASLIRAARQRAEQNPISDAGGSMAGMPGMTPTSTGRQN